MSQTISLEQSGYGTLEEAVADYGGEAEFALSENPPYGCREMLWAYDEFIETFPHEARRLIVERQSAIQNEVCDRLAHGAVEPIFSAILESWPRWPRIWMLGSPEVIRPMVSSRIWLLVDEETLSRITHEVASHIRDRAKGIVRMGSPLRSKDQIRKELLAIMRERLREDQKLFNDLPVGPEGGPADQWLFDLVVEYGYLSERLRLADSQPEYNKRLGAAFVQALALRGLGPIDFLTAGSDPALREQWFNDARELLSSPSDDADEPNREFVAPAFLACRPEDWARAMDALGLEVSPETGRYIWPRDYPFWMARELIDQLRERAPVRVFTTPKIGYAKAFKGLFYTERASGEDLKTLEHALVRGGKRRPQENPKWFALIDRAVGTLTQRPPLIRKPRTHSD